LLFHHPTGTVCRGHFLAGEYRECLKCNSRNEGKLKSVWLLLSAFLRHAMSRRATANVAPSVHVAARQALPRTITIAHGDPNTFAYLGRLVIEKGLSVLLEASHLLRAEGRELHLLLIGDGPDRIRLQKEINTLGLETTVRILGFLPRKDLDLALRPIHTLIIPTIMEETAGLAAMEQMMRGRLVIASAVGGLQEVVGDSGLLFPPGDATALAALMKKVLQQPDLIGALGAQARARAHALFARDRMIEEHADVYRKAALQTDF
jgi:glycosyltransferase involved in cell wall biosynthesis